MGRLTKYGNTSHENGVCCTHFMSKECKEVGGECSYGCKWEEEAWSKLAHYEDLEEQGRLIELPCAVGDTVWEIDEYAEGFKARPMAVLSIELKENKGYVYTTYSDEHDVFARGYGFDDFGEILFLTKEEAEAKLKELEGVKE